METSHQSRSVHLRFSDVKRDDENIDRQAGGETCKVLEQKKNIYIYHLSPLLYFLFVLRGALNYMKGQKKRESVLFYQSVTVCEWEDFC